MVLLGAAHGGISNWQRLDVRWEHGMHKWCWLHIFLSLRGENVSSGQTFGRFVCLFVVCLLDLHLILLRRMVQHCGQSEYDYGR